MDIKRLKELKSEFEEERKCNDMHYMSTATEDDVLELIDEAIAHKSIASEEVQRAIELLREPSKCMDYYWLDAQMHDALNIAITALKEYQQWIPVSESLPDGDVASVLIYTKEGGVAEGQYYPTIRAWKQFRWPVEDSKVTHWKPLPEPPKGE